MTADLTYSLSYFCHRPGHSHMYCPLKTMKVQGNSKSYFYREEIPSGGSNLGQILQPWVHQEPRQNDRLLSFTQEVPGIEETNNFKAFGEPTNSRSNCLRL